MTIIISDKDSAWPTTRGMWFHNYPGAEFEVLEVHGGREPVYEVNVSHLASRGDLSFLEAFVPAAFAELATTRSGQLSESYA